MSRYSCYILYQRYSSLKKQDCCFWINYCSVINASFSSLHASISLESFVRLTKPDPLTTRLAIPQAAKKSAVTSRQLSAKHRAWKAPYALCKLSLQKTRHYEVPGVSGGLYWTRTSDPIDVNDVLYQLSQQTRSAIKRFNIKAQGGGSVKIEALIFRFVFASFAPSALPLRFA